MTVTARALAGRLDELLRTREVPDYPGAVNGLQCDHRGPVSRLGAAVDCSQRTIALAAERGVNFLIVHHGMFWGGVQPIAGAWYARLRLLFDHDIAVYSSHLPLDAHPELGNNVLLARSLALTPSRPFAWYQGVAIGVAGDADVATQALVVGANALASRHGGTVRATAIAPGQRTRRWAICTGAGASTDTLREAVATGVDTLIVGEGPHHTAVEAAEAGLTIVYAGHYATETLGVQAVAARVADWYGLAWEFLSAPTGL